MKALVCNSVHEAKACSMQGIKAFVFTHFVLLIDLNTEIMGQVDKLK